MACEGHLLCMARQRLTHELNRSLAMHGVQACAWHADGWRWCNAGLCEADYWHATWRELGYGQSRTWVADAAYEAVWRTCSDVAAGFALAWEQAVDSRDAGRAS